MAEGETIAPHGGTLVSLVLSKAEAITAVSSAVNWKSMR